MESKAEAASPATENDAALAQALAASMDSFAANMPVCQQTFAADLEQQVSMLHDDRVALDKEKLAFEREKKEMAERFPQADVITLNVGGTLFTTFKSTLVKHEGSMLAALFSGRYPLAKDANGNPFIDRNPQMFAITLDWLRSDKMILPANLSAEERMRLDDDLDYFGLKDFVMPPFALLTQKQSQSLWTMLGKLPAAVSKARCLFQASKDGFAAAAFHAKCDGHGNTVTIVRSSNGSLFGGFTPLPWASNGRFALDTSNTSFLFSLFSASEPHRAPAKLPIFQSFNDKAIHCRASFGPSFGWRDDLVLTDQCNDNSASSSNLGSTYETRHSKSDEGTVQVA